LWFSCHVYRVFFSAVDLESDTQTDSSIQQEVESKDMTAEDPTSDSM